MFPLISLPPALAVLLATTILPTTSHASSLERTAIHKDNYSTRSQARLAKHGNEQYILDDADVRHIPTTSSGSGAVEPTKAPWLAIVVSRTTATTTISNGTVPTAPTAPNIVWERGVMKQKEHHAEARRPSSLSASSARATAPPRMCSLFLRSARDHDWQPIW